MAPARQQSFTPHPHEASVAKDDDASDRINSDLDIQRHIVPKTEISERKTGIRRCADRGDRLRVDRRSTKNNRANHRWISLNLDLGSAPTGRSRQAGSGQCSHRPLPTQTLLTARVAVAVAWIRSDAWAWRCSPPRDLPYVIIKSYERTEALSISPCMHDMMRLATLAVAATTSRHHPSRRAMGRKHVPRSLFRTIQRTKIMKQGPVVADGRTSFAHGVVRPRPGRKHGKEPAGGEIGGAARVLSYCRSLLLPCLAPDRSSVSTLLSAKSLCKASTSNRAISPLLPSSPSDAFTLPYLFCLVFCIICLLPLPDMWYDLISLAEEKRREEEGADLSSMGNCKSSSRALLGKAHVVPDSEWRMQDFGKTHVPDLEWRINDFSSLLETLLETGAKSATSATFHCSGYNWHLQVIPMHKETGSETPYVALRLMTSQESMVPGHTMHVVFELSMYNHSKGMYYGCKATYNFHFKNTYSKEHCLIPLQELLKSSAFLVDDSCVFGVEILKMDVSSPEKKAVVVQKKATTVQNLFVQKKGFVKGTYTWNMTISLNWTWIT